MALQEEMRKLNLDDLALVITEKFSCHHCRNLYEHIEGKCKCKEKCIEVAKYKLSNDYK